MTTPSEYWSERSSPRPPFACSGERYWPVPSIAYRVEGVPIHDAFGKSDGFRRPGTIGFVEPGINMQLRGNLLSFSVAIRQYVNIKDSPTSTRREDATVPKYMFFAAYSRRLN